MKKLFFVFIISLFFLSSISLRSAQAETTEPVMKVKLINYLGNKNDISIQTSSNASTSDVEVNLKAGDIYHLKVEEGKISFYQGSSKIKTVDSLELYTNQTDTTLINGRSYMGGFRFEVENNKYIRPINFVRLEQYLKGVVPNEMIPSWHVEALKAQAIAARTYALRNSNKTINDTVQYQVYGGNTHYTNTDKAVEDTYGQALIYGGNYIDALYSSSNGGKTESNANAWGGSNLPYFPIKEDPYDPKNPWTLTFHRKQINLEDKDLKNVDTWWDSVTEQDKVVTDNVKKYLAQHGYEGKDVKIVEIPTLNFTDKLSGDRYSKGNLEFSFVVKGDVNDKGELNIKHMNFSNAKAADIRPIVGTSFVKSYYITKQEINDDTITLSGLGFGHGVGMSQYGAQAMAKQGSSYQNILNFYYPSTTFSKQYEPTSVAITERLAGAERYETAVSISQKGWSSANTVVLASGEQFPDALAGATLASKEGGPLLLTRSNKLNNVTRQEISRLGAKKAIILGPLGGEGSSVKNELTAMGLDVERIYGADRYETSVEIAKRINSNKAIVASGLNFPDALSVASYAAKNQIPILLTRPDRIPSPVSSMLATKTETIVVGGTGVISDGVMDQIPNPTRYGGATRYDTNIQVVKNLALGKQRAYIANGEDFPDALSGSVLAAKENASIILTLSNKLPTETQSFVNEYNQFGILGGEGVVSSSISDYLKDVTIKNMMK
ncbi:hypothetical protein CIB87_17940 [Priestia megaterium]|uniref:Sporulation stage II protein D amidase enhancer LytB N-terminal domain-containing protein n=1 Tax=Priestia megaterium TaxID=1404 RepID=A0AA86LWT7_PRIMG|nr:SpoIID/LytB domain-containing protein [Priestia megaterium]AXI30807.1 hypothetical protein CIB87_17940 [Priestia megaterium]